MPLFLERFPWPSLQTYTALSAVLLAGTILSAYNTVTESKLDIDVTESKLDIAVTEETQDHRTRIGEDLWDGEEHLSYGNVATDVLIYLVTDSVLVWVSMLSSTACAPFCHKTTHNLKRLLK